MQNSAAQDIHVVVFDVNVYLDVARILDPPYSLQTLGAVSAVNINSPCPHPTNPLIDSLRALALCTSGRFVGQQKLEVWTSKHIDDLVVHKLTQPIDGASPELTGFGWKMDEAEDFLHELVYGLVFDASKGGSAGDVSIAAGSPPLSYEDGRVFRTALEAGDSTDGQLIKYCITNDKEFRNNEPNLSSEVLVLYPAEWVLLVRRARNLVAMGRLRPRD